MELDRFLKAQEKDFETALIEIKGGRKRTHWMWYIFPQVQGLGSTEISRHYAVVNMQEASDYLAHEILGLRLTTICKALLELPGDNAIEIFGSPDYLKLKSSMTLFDAVPHTNPVFSEVLDKFYGGERDKRTLSLLSNK